MSHESFEFLQIADLRLDQPCGGMTEVPESLRDLLLDAPYLAAEKAFDLAIENGVDFVLLSGHTADLRTSGPRAALFLEQQFERLSQKQIPIYWAAGPQDPVWDDALDVQWPRNVRLFPRTHAETILLERHGVAIVRFIGRSGEASAWHMNDHVVTESHIYTIGLGLIPPEQVDGKRWDVDFWAMHGEHKPSDNDKSLTPVANVYFQNSGSTQGRSFDEPGTHGCTLVTVADDRKVRMRTCATDVLRYFDEVVTCNARAERKVLEGHLHRRAESLREQHPTSTMVARFTLGSDTDQLPPAIWDQWLPEMTAQLRRDFGGGNHPLWAVEIDVLPQVIPIGLLEQESIIGDYLRALHEQEAITSDKRFVAETFGIAGPMASQLSEYMNWNDPQARKRTMQEAAWLGIKLLNSEEVVR
jgi:DNA repair exonuclease SbcCD nuclease subunit